MAPERQGIARLRARPEQGPRRPRMSAGDSSAPPPHPKERYAGRIVNWTWSGRNPGQVAERRPSAPGRRPAPSWTPNSKLNTPDDEPRERLGLGRVPANRAGRRRRKRHPGGGVETLRQKDRGRTELWRVSGSGHSGPRRNTNGEFVPVRASTAETVISQVKGTEDGQPARGLPSFSLGLARHTSR